VPSFDELNPQQLADLLLKAAKKGKAPRLDIPGYEIEKGTRPWRLRRRFPRPPLE
jgi:hypothetical protein